MHRPEAWPCRGAVGWRLAAVAAAQGCHGGLRLPSGPRPGAAVAYRAAQPTPSACTGRGPGHAVGRGLCYGCSGPSAGRLPGLGTGMAGQQPPGRGPGLPGHACRAPARPRPAQAAGLAAVGRAEASRQPLPCHQARPHVATASACCACGTQAGAEHGWPARRHGGGPAEGRGRERRLRRLPASTKATPTRPGTGGQAWLASRVPRARGR